LANTHDIVIPDLGDFDEVEVIEILVSAGDQVAREDGLITLETDKATMDVPAADDGVIESITINVGDNVSSGSVIGTITVAASDIDKSTGDTVVIKPAFEPEIIQGETTVVAQPAGETTTIAGGIKTIEVPDLGDFDDVEVIEVLVSVGDTVQIEDPLLTLETDKAAMDIPSIVAGKIDAVLVKVGDKVSKGSPVVVIDAVETTVTETVAAAEAPPAVKAPAAPQQAAQARVPVTPTSLPAIEESGFSKAHASPSVRKLARELGVNLAQVKGSGSRDRILHDDVKAFVKAIMTGGAAAPGAGTGLPKTPVIDFAKFGEIDVQPLTRIQKISGPRLQASWINLPHVTQHDLADITELEAKRQQLKGAAKERGIGLTPLAFVMKACIATLKEFPKANASLSEDNKSLVYKNYYHLGFAADTDNGLMVPVIRDADKMDVYELAKSLGELSLAAREGKLKSDQLQGASFTVSSLGGIGGTAFTPIVNAPEVAILGVSRSSMQPVWNGEKFTPRLMLPLSLSYDHRVVDGAYAVRFTTYLSQKLADVESLLQAIP
jgi:pyruvate dehydrogenase E2 component (dihydrolipoamide acetyltransferase)